MDSIDNELKPAEAYERVLPEIMALPKEAVRRPNLEILPAVSTALGTLPRLRPLRDRLAGLIEFDIACVDRLEDYSLALMEANARFQLTYEAHDDLPALLAEAIETRDRLVGDARALVSYDLIDGTSLRNVSRSSGYKQVAMDLQMLVTVLGDVLPEIEGKSCVQRAELDRAATVAACMLRLVGSRQRRPSSRAEARDLRARAFTLFLHAYEQARRGAEFLFFGDPEREGFVPCLYSKGGGIRRKPRTKSGRPGDGVIEAAGAAVPTSPPLFSPPHLLPSAQT